METIIHNNKKYYALQVPFNEPETIAERIQQIKDVVSVYTGIENYDNNSRLRPFTKARQLAHYFTRERYGYSLSLIGKKIGNKDHATVLNSIKVISSLKRYPEEQELINNISKTLDNLNL